MDNNDSNWINNPALQNIDAAKLQMLMSMANQGRNKSQNELLPFLMSAAAQSRESGNSFSSDEINLILDVLKQGKSPAEMSRINQLVNLMQQMRGPLNGRRP